MASYDKFDARLDSLVVETTTAWGDDVADLSQEDRLWLARAIHEKPQLASKIHYERTHTGFTREITITSADIERLYADRFEH
jgi:hypothetical protein